MTQISYKAYMRARKLVREMGEYAAPRLNNFGIIHPLDFDLIAQAQRLMEMFQQQRQAMKATAVK
ncbi:MAG: hypothetical protein LBO08_02390 [Rickettsiales bacterium]|nr:hypothetical protein [Rickettsiales bacterium]